MDDRKQSKAPRAEAPQKAASPVDDIGHEAMKSEPKTDPQTHKRSPENAGPRFTVDLRTPDGQVVSRTNGADSWRALHEFSGLASQDLGKRLGVGASAQLTDREGVYGVQLEVDSTGANQLKFDTDEGRALYRQVYRERQMAVSQAPMINRIDAMPAEPEQKTSEHADRDAAVDRSAASDSMGKSGRTGEGANSTRSLREQVLEQLAHRNQPETAGDQLRNGRLQHARDQDIVGRATVGQLGLIAAELANDDPRRLRGVMDRVKEEVDSSVSPRRPQEAEAGQAQHGMARTAEDPDKAKRPMIQDPPIRDRFTAIEHTWRTDYWQRDRPDRLGFTETWLTLKTSEHNTAVLMGMVDRARERGWAKLHLDGSPEFKREAWILANARGLQTSGYTATLGDREAAKTEQHRLEQASRNRSEPSRQQLRPLQAQGQIDRPIADQSQMSRGKAREAHLGAALTKAMQEAQVPPALQARLRALMTEDRLRPSKPAAEWQFKVYDAAAPRSQPQPTLSHRRPSKERQREL